MNQPSPGHQPWLVSQTMTGGGRKAAQVTAFCYPSISYIQHISVVVYDLIDKVVVTVFTATPAADSRSCCRVSAAAFVAPLFSARCEFRLGSLINKNETRALRSINASHHSPQSPSNPASACLCRTQQLCIFLYSVLLFFFPSHFIFLF